VPHAFHTGLSTPDMAELAHAFIGQLPGVLVALGRKLYSPHGVGLSTHFRTEIDVHVYICSDNERSLLARVEQDAGSIGDNRRDPGVDVILEHVEELLVGYQISSTVDTSETIYRLEPVDEDELDAGAGFTMWAQTYRVAVEREVRPFASVDQYVDALRSEYREAAAETQNPILIAEHIP
jgi:hypothetical protein